MKFNDAISGLLLLCLGIGILLAISAYPQIPGQDIGPAAFPGLLAIILIGCALVLIWRGLQDRDQPWVSFGLWLRSPEKIRNFSVVIGALLFYIFFVDWTGFILCSALILTVLLLSFGVRLILILPLATGVTLVIHTVFYKLLRVPLPWGLLQDWQW